jgi:zinc transport system substrate-binding protein
MKLLAPITLLLAASISMPALAAPAVVASTKPVHSLVSAVMAGVGEPYLIVKGAASPHTYALRPSDAEALENSDLVFWTGEGFEVFLEGALKSLAGTAETVALADASGLTLLPVREGGAFEAHAHGEGEEGHHADHDHHDDEHGHDHGEGATDMHFWLDPENAKILVTQIGDVLIRQDPANAAAYAANMASTQADLDALTAELLVALAPVADKPFIVFHDAYQYFETRFGLTLVGTVTVSPEVAPGAARIDELRARIAGLGAACIFAEPNFPPAIVDVIVEGTDARAGTLDPEASGLAEGPDLYAELLRSLAQGILDCQG